MDEQWKTLPSNAAYEVSDRGRVRSRDQEVWGGPRVGFYTKLGKLLKPGIASNGYPTVALGRGNTRTVHSLVTETFLGECPAGHEVRHKDGNRKNPKLENLHYGTRGENIADAIEHGTRTSETLNHRKAVATKDRKYPGWRQRVFKPGRLLSCVM